MSGFANSEAAERPIERIGAAAKPRRTERAVNSRRIKAARGMGRVFLRGRVWWISFYLNGREVRESAKSENENAAVKLLKQRLGETETGQCVVDEKKISFENMVEWLEA